MVTHIHAFTFVHTVRLHAQGLTCMVYPRACSVGYNTLVCCHTRCQLQYIRFVQTVGRTVHTLTCYTGRPIRNLRQCTRKHEVGLPTSLYGTWGPTSLHNKQQRTRILYARLCGCVRVRACLCMYSVC